MAYFKCNPTSSGGDLVTLLTNFPSANFISVSSYQYTSAVVGKHYLIMVEGIKNNGSVTFSWSGATVTWSKVLTNYLSGATSAYSGSVLALVEATSTTIKSISSSGSTSTSSYKMLLMKLD